MEDYKWKLERKINIRKGDIKFNLYRYSTDWGILYTTEINESIAHYFYEPLEAITDYLKK